MFCMKPFASRRPCPKCGGPLDYVATFLTLITGLRKRKCRDCGYVDATRVKIVTG
jgi:hypothetical protein